MNCSAVILAIGIPAIAVLLACALAGSGGAAAVAAAAGTVGASGILIAVCRTMCGRGREDCHGG